MLTSDNVTICLLPPLVVVYLLSLLIENEKSLLLKSRYLYIQKHKIVMGLKLT